MHEMQQPHDWCSDTASEIAGHDKVLNLCQCEIFRFDVETGRRVRTFVGHRDRITDIGVSQDGKWLLSSSMDASLRIWDIPASRILQVRTPDLHQIDEREMKGLRLRKVGLLDPICKLLAIIS